MDRSKPHWLAIYTRPRNERKVFERLLALGHEAYLPLQKRLKQWSDRKKWVNEPLLPSYVFVKTTQPHYFEILAVHGIVKFVSFGKEPSLIPEDQILLLRSLIEQDIEIETIEQNFEPGETVEVQFGSLAGFTGEMVNYKGKNRVIISIDHVSHRLMATLPVNYVVRKIKK